MSKLWEININSDEGLQVLEDYLSEGGDPDEIGYPELSEEPGTRLDEAVFFGYYKAVEILLRYGANPNRVHSLLETPLAMASSAGYLDICELLVQSGADVNLERVVQLIPGLKWSQYPYETALSRAAKNNRYKIIDFLICNGAQVNTIVDSVPLLGELISPISIAARKGHVKSVETLIKGGADVNLMHPIGYSALHESIVNSHLDIFELLVNNGADIHQRGTIYGATPLWLAKDTVSRRPTPESKKIRDYLVQNGGVARLHLWAEILRFSGLVNFS